VVAKFLGGEKVVIKIYDYVEKAAKLLLVISLAIMALINIANVLSRYVLHASLSFTEEITANIFVYNTFIGAAIAARRGGHLGLTIITDRLPNKYNRVVTLLVSIISAGLYGILIYMGYGMVESQITYGQRTAALAVPEWIFGLAIPIGAFFIMISFIVGGYEAFREKGEE